MWLYQLPGRRSWGWIFIFHIVWIIPKWGIMFIGDHQHRNKLSFRNTFRNWLFGTINGFSVRTTTTKNIWVVQVLQPLTKALWHPKPCAYHRIPSERMKKEKGNFFLLFSLDTYFKRFFIPKPLRISLLVSWPSVSLAPPLNSPASQNLATLLHSPSKCS